MTSVGSYCLLTLPSSSFTFDMTERKGKIRKVATLASRRRVLLRLAGVLRCQMMTTTLQILARKVKWAKTTVTQRDIRMQIDKEFERDIFESQNHVDRLQSENEQLKNASAALLNKCATLLNDAKTLAVVSQYTVQDEWNVPGGEVPDSDADLIVFYPLYDSKVSSKPLKWY